MKSERAPAYFAHTLEGKSVEDWQPLIEHLDCVAKLAARHAAAFDSADWGNAAGYWHDLGKYAKDFQDYLGSFAVDPDIVDASVVDGKPGRVDHSTAGAVHVHRLCAGRLTRDDEMPAAEKALAMVIAGHHSGLPKRCLFEAERLAKAEKQALFDAASRHGAPEIDALLNLELPAPPAMLHPRAFAGMTDRKAATREAYLRYEFWTRMLFSALIDADRLDTERFMDPEKWEVREASKPGTDVLTRLRERVDGHLEKVTAAAREKSAGLPAEARSRAEAVLDLRADVLTGCRRAAEREPGRHSLTVPTGGGKTLAALAFALKHAVRHGLRRVIVVIPFTSIIDQTAGVYRDAFGEMNGKNILIEHHSNLDPAAESYGNRLASENWDAPVIVTTSVQFFESLFSAKGTAARKLHNIARSVVVFDEVQTLPHKLRAPIFDALNRLVDHYGVSALFCTATQPALELARLNRQGFPNLPGVVEVVDDVPAAFKAVEGRVEVDFSRALESTIWEALAAEVRELPRVLVIVQRRDDARALRELLPSGTFHLSALMCAEHRRGVLGRIAEALKGKGPCRVVSTTLVEAGVDLDFPVVYRDLGGVDALAQAAGRCNREGRLTDDQGLPIPGRLIVFRSPSDPPPGLKRGAETTAILLKQLGRLDLFDPDTYRTYFARYFSDINPDANDVMGARVDRDFPEIATRFRMIDDQGQATIVVPFADAADRIEAYRAAPNRETLRALQPFVVNVPARVLKDFISERVIETIHDQVHWLRPIGPGQYHEVFGLNVGEIAPGSPEDWIA